MLSVSSQDFGQIKYSIYGVKSFYLRDVPSKPATEVKFEAIITNSLTTRPEQQSNR
jgi:hypothetical protein